MWYSSKHQSVVDELNQFFCGFDEVDDKQKCDESCKNLPEGAPTANTEDAGAKGLFKLKPNEATASQFHLFASLLKLWKPSNNLIQSSTVIWASLKTQILSLRNDHSNSVLED